VNIELKEIDINLLREADYNLKDGTVDDDIQWLARSIAHKVLQNLTVVEPEVEGQETYEVVCGNRRLKAAKIAGRKTLPCRVISKDHTKAERRLMNLTENVQRKDLSYDQLYIYVAEILKAFNDNTKMVAFKLGWPEHRVLDIIKYGSLSERVKGVIKDADDFRNAVSCVGLPDEKILHTMKLAREQGFGVRTVTNIAEIMKRDPELEPELAAEEAEGRGTKVTVTFDGEWNASLTNAINKIDTTKQEYVEEATKRRLVIDGFHPEIVMSVEQQARRRRQDLNRTSRDDRRVRRRHRHGRGG
jgi:ParB family transcriptional regulator, chromosome partitioning protein